MPTPKVYNRKTETPGPDNTRRMTLILHNDLYERLRIVSVATRRPMTDIYREALVRLLDDLQPPTE